jgi:hypothetical protein
MSEAPPPYLTPYLRALEEHGDGFESLLWASRKTQALRFEAIARLHPLAGQRLVDAGCGRADLLEHLLGLGIQPAWYIGLEALAGHLAHARRKALPGCTLVEVDFIREPRSLLVGADVAIFCGSLNTMDQATFRRIIGIGLAAAREAVIFNFLCSPALAGADWLIRHEKQEVLEFARSLARDVSLADDYLEGDCTICIRQGGGQ